MVFFVGLFWSLAVYAADAGAIVAALKKEGVLVAGSDAKALAVIERMNQSTWFDIGWAIKLLGVLIVIVVMHAYILKIIKNIWFLLSRIPLWIYQLSALCITSYPAFMPAAIWPEQYEVVGLVGGVAWLGAIGWMAHTYKYTLLMWLARVKIPTNLRLILLATAVCVGFTYVQQVWFWMWPLPLIVVPLTMLKATEKQWYSFDPSHWDMAVNEKYVLAAIGIGYMVLGDMYMTMLYVGVATFPAFILGTARPRWEDQMGRFILPTVVVAIGMSGMLLPVYAFFVGRIGSIIFNLYTKLMKYSKLLTSLMTGLLLVGLGIALQNYAVKMYTMLQAVLHFVLKSYFSWPSHYTVNAYF